MLVFSEVYLSSSVGLKKPLSKREIRGHGVRFVLFDVFMCFLCEFEGLKLEVLRALASR